MSGVKNAGSILQENLSAYELVRSLIVLGLRNVGKSPPPTGGGPPNYTLEVQNMHLFASLGISPKHSGHFFSVGSSGVLLLEALSCSLFSGLTTKKNITAEIIKNEISAFKNKP